MCLAQGHNSVPPIKLEPATPRFRVKYSTPEPLRSHGKGLIVDLGEIVGDRTCAVLFAGLSHVVCRRYIGQLYTIR